LREDVGEKVETQVHAEETEKAEAPGKTYYFKEYEVEETGQKVKVKMEADKALEQVEDELFHLKALKDCIG